MRTIDGFKTVTKGEFFDFISGKNLEISEHHIFDPPLKIYFENKVMIAYIVMDWLRDGKTTTGDEYYEYRVMESGND